jgi:uncharacterized protein with beta-barrel porin domain
VGGTYSFTDTTRHGDSIPLNTRVTFPSVPGFSATVTGFAGGVFTLDRPVPVGIAADDVYALAVDESDERAGADAQGYATGVDLSGAHVRLVNAGTLEVEATARADTAVVAVVATASAAGVAEARGLRTGVGDDQVENTGSITVGATVATTASTGAVDQRALAVGIDTGGGDDLVINRGDITVSGAVGAAGSSGTSGVDVVGIRTGAGNDTVLAAGNITATITAGTGTALAISTEDGNDHVSLLAGLRTAQDVALGAGDDTLLLAAGAAFTGTARADPGRDSFVLGGDADGSFAMAEIGDAARYRGFDVYRKQGRSTWTLTGDAAMDWVVDAGVLALRDTLTGTLATSAGSPGGVAEVLAGARLRGPDGVAPALLDGAGGLVNYGWIEGVGVTGDQVGVRIVGSGNTLFNAGAGTILARADGAGRAAGILLQGSGALAVNEGLVQAEGASGSAVVLSGVGNVLLNRGRLTSFDAAARFEGLAGAANTLLNDVGGTVESTGGMPIAGGPGNDTVENHGRVVGPTARLIDLGAGDDRLLIGASSVIDGTADGGTGADTFVLGGRVDAAFELGQIGTKYTGFELFRKEGASRWSVSGTAGGPWNVGGGTLSVNGTLPGPVVVEAPGRLGGNGTVGSLVNYGTVAPGNSIGVVTVAGDYTHAAGAVLEIEVEGLRSDRLDVGGRAALAGGAVKVVPAGRFGIATEYTILTAAGGISGAFDSAYATAGFLDADLDYAADRVLLTVIRNDFSFASFARTYNQRAVGLALDADKKAAARGDFKTVIDEFLTLTPEQVGGALDALSGELHATTQGVLMRSGDWFLATAVDRAARLQQVQEEGRTVWLDVYGGLGSVDGDGNASAADYRASGLALGVDYAVDPATRLGVAFGYSSSTTDLDRAGAGEADADTYHIALYGEYADGPWDLRGAATYSRHGVEATRHIAYGSVARVAEADYDANQYTLYLRGGYDLPGPALSTLQPYVSLAYSRLDRPDFNETGAGSLDLQVEDETTESLVSVLGLRARWDQEWGKARVQPELRIGWAHQFLDDTDVMSANLAGAPSALGYQGFTVRSPATGRDSLVLGAALTAEVGKSTRLFLSYDGVMNGDQSDHAFVGGVRVEW